MPLTLEQIRTTISRDEALESLLTVLTSLGFNTTSWQSGSVQRTFLTGCAEVWSQLSEVADGLSRLCFNDTATGDALTALSSSHYDNTRTAATYTVGDVVLTGAAVGPPHVVAIGDLTVADVTNGYTYRNITGGTVPASGTVTLSFQAEVAGSSRNVADSTITVLQTPLAGVTVDNPGPNWRTTDGADQETDAVLATRNTTRWSTLSYSSPTDGYVNFALSADSTVTRVQVDDSAAATGDVTVYIADNNGGCAAGVVTTVQTYIDTKRPVTADVTVVSAAEQAQAFTATIYVTAALNNATKQTEIEDALDDFVNGLDIQGTQIAGTGYMLMSELNEAVSSVTGVEAIQWTTPTADVVIPAATVLTLGAKTLTFTSI